MSKFTLLLLSSFALVSTSFAQAEHKVSTDIQKKKILLEEFTGLNCGWCPEGHLVGKQLLNALPGQAFAVNIHAGHYSEPSTGQADYRTDEGIALATFFNTESGGYPCGTVNRFDIGDGQYILSRSNWIPVAKALNQQDAPVNLYVDSKYDGLTKTLSVTVEGYFTGDVPADSAQRLNVLWTQDDIVGYQNGGGAGDNYVHEHMLRGYISQMFGDTIANAAKGQYFSKSYSVTLPSDIRDIEVKPEDINIIAFVTAGKTDVENVEGGKPEYTNYNETEAGELIKPDLQIGTRYGYNYFEAYLKNKSGKRITSATFDVTVNGQTETATVACDIDQFSTAALKIPATMSYAAKGKTKYNVELRQMNGVDVESSTLSGGFQKPAVTNSSVEVQILTDACASQNTFTLKDADGNVIRTFGPYEDGKAATYDETVNGLEDGKTYCIELIDTYGDGMYDGGKGGLIVHAGTGKLIDQFYSVSGYGVRSFFTVDLAAGINQTTTTATNGGKTVYTIDGRKVNSQPRTGLYIVHSDKGTAKMIIK